MTEENKILYTVGPVGGTTGTITAPCGPYHLIKPTESSEWKCYMFGSTDGSGITYRPIKGGEPNWFVRWMMKICFACTWIKEKK
jgi:hypothetical protein